MKLKNVVLSFFLSFLARTSFVYLTGIVVRVKVKSKIMSALCSNVDGKVDDNNNDDDTDKGTNELKIIVDAMLVHRDRGTI